MFICQYCNGSVAYRIRAQDNLELPTGIPDHMFAFPENYEGKNKGSEIPEDLLDEVAQVSGTVMDADIENESFIEEDLL